MIRISLFLFAIICFTASCTSDSKQAANEAATASGSNAAAQESSAKNVEEYAWTQLAENPGYSKTYNYQMLMGCNAG